MIRLLLSILLLLGPLYRYLRAIFIGVPLIRYFPFIMEGFLFIIMAVSFFVSASKRKQEFSATFIDKTVFVFLFSTLLGSLFIASRQGFLDQIDFLRVYILPLSVYFATRYFVKDKVLTLLKFYILSVAISVFFLGYEFLAINYMGLGDVFMKPYWDATGITGYHGSAGEYMFFGYITRPWGPLGLPQTSGVFYLIAFVYWITISKMSKMSKINNALIGLLLFTGMFLTGSRTAIFILIIVFIPLFIQWIRKEKNVAIAGLKSLFLLLIFFLIIVLLFPTFGKLLLNPSKYISNYALSLNLFFSLLENDLSSFAPHKILFGHYFASGISSAQETFTPSFFYASGEMSIINMFIELGLISFLSLVVIFLTSIKYASVVKTYLPEDRIARVWKLLVLIIFFASFHYSALFRYGIDIFYMVLLGCLSYKFNIIQRVHKSQRLDGVRDGRVGMTE